jgi:hypothetical protein
MMLAASTLMLALAALPVRAQDSVQTYPASFPALQPRKVVPFDTGERLTYDVRFGAIKVGTGRMEVVGTQDIRGRESWHTRFTVKGGIPFYKVNDRLESWIDTRTLNSLRFHKDQNEGRREKEIMIELFPERQSFSENDKPEVPSVRVEPSMVMTRVCVAPGCTVNFIGVTFTEAPAVADVDTSKVRGRLVVLKAVRVDEMRPGRRGA